MAVCVWPRLRRDPAAYAISDVRSNNTAAFLITNGDCDSSFIPRSRECRAGTRATRRRLLWRGTKTNLGADATAFTRTDCTTFCYARTDPTAFARADFNTIFYARTDLTAFTRTDFTIFCYVGAEFATNINADDYGTICRPNGVRRTDRHARNTDSAARIDVSTSEEIVDERAAEASSWPKTEIYGSRHRASTGLGLSTASGSNTVSQLQRDGADA